MLNYAFSKKTKSIFLGVDFACIYANAFNLGLTQFSKKLYVSVFANPYASVYKLVIFKPNSNEHIIWWLSTTHKPQRGYG